MMCTLAKLLKYSYTLKCRGLLPLLQPFLNDPFPLDSTMWLTTVTCVVYVTFCTSFTLQDVTAMNSKTKQLQPAMPQDFTSWLHFISVVVSCNIFSFSDKYRSVSTAAFFRILPNSSFKIIFQYITYIVLTVLRIMPLWYTGE
jgi:hypothetical protein